MGPIEPEGFFPGLSNRDAPPRNKTAAPIGTGTAAQEIGKAGNRSEADVYTVPRIIATHFGLEREELARGG
jgi:hypothetical protein